MFTDNKVHVVDRGDADLARTLSGGVNEPSDPKHFPALGNSVASPRAMSRLQGSFKDRLLKEGRDDSSNSGQSEAVGTEATSKLAMEADYTRNASPRISAGRDVTQGVRLVASGEASGCEADERQEVGQI